MNFKKIFIFLICSYTLIFSLNGALKIEISEPLFLPADKQEASGINTENNDLHLLSVHYLYNPSVRAENKEFEKDVSRSFNALSGINPNLPEHIRKVLINNTPIFQKKFQSMDSIFL